MKQSVRNALYQAILENRWVDVRYVNAKNVDSHFYIGINDLDVSNDKLYCEIFNSYKDNRCLEEPMPITISKIYYAKVIDQSYYPIPKSLVSRLDYDKELLNFLDVNSMDNDILRYLSDCYNLDNDPYIKDKVLLNGVDCEELLKEKKYILDDQQFVDLLNNLFKADPYEAEKTYRLSKDIAINVFSIDIRGKQYVVAYHSVSVNFKDRTLKINEKININKSFTIEEGKTATLSQYLDMSADEFCNGFIQNPREYIDLIKENFRQNERVDTSPKLFVLERKISAGVDRTFEQIHKLQDQNELTFPLKSFFGRNRNGAGSNKETNIVVFDKAKVNIDQMRVIYNSMINHVTYVKGPPGTGKTETIFNILLSAYYNDKKVLVCSNNNHPVDDITEKMAKNLSMNIATKEERNNFIFPIVRLGNNDEMLKTTLPFLINCYNLAVDFKNTSIPNSKMENNKEASLSGFQELKNLLQEYEEKIDLEEKVQNLIKLNGLTTSGRIADEIKHQIEVQNAKISNMRELKDEDVAKHSVSASEDEAFQDFVYYSSLARLKKLLNPTYKELVTILKMGCNSDAVTELNKYLRNDVNLRRFTDIFPIVITTNVSSDKLGNPTQHFDLCIMDEAGQCNVAISLIPIVRAKNLLLVGDTNQLQPVTVIETDINERLMERYNIKKEYNYVKNSILSTMLSKDNNSKNILLRYHYRCGKKIAQFVNSRFYEQQLKLLNKIEGSLLYLNVKNTKIPSMRNAYCEEAMGIVELIKKNGYKKVGIVTPFVNQAALINECLVKEGFDLSNIKAGTIHTLQGSEKPIIIMSSALSLKTGRKTMEWIKNNHELINVAVTRAQEMFVFAGDKEAIDTLSRGEMNDIKALSDYVASNGTIQAPPSGVRISTDFSNDSDSEKDFFETVTPYFTRRGCKLRIERNVPVNVAIKAASQEDLDAMGQKEFDFIVQGFEPKGLFRRSVFETKVVFEIDGGEHVGSRITSKRDRIKEEICEKYHIKLIRIANSDVKDYQLIIHLFESITKGIPDIENVGEQLSLFEES